MHLHVLGIFFLTIPNQAFSKGTNSSPFFTFDEKIEHGRKKVKKYHAEKLRLLSEVSNLKNSIDELKKNPFEGSSELMRVYENDLKNAELTASDNARWVQKWRWRIRLAMNESLKLVDVCTPGKSEDLSSFKPNLQTLHRVGSNDSIGSSSSEELLRIIETRPVDCDADFDQAIEAASRLYSNSPEPAVSAFDDRFGRDWQARHPEAIRIARGRISPELRPALDNLLADINNPTLAVKRAIKNDVRNFYEVPGAATPIGLMSATEGRVHYDAIQRDLPAASYMHERPFTARIEGHGLNIEAIDGISKLAKEQFDAGKDSATVVLGNGAHWVTLTLNRKNREIALIDSMKDSHYFSDNEQRILEDIIHAHNPTFTKRTRMISAEQQKDGHNCMIFALLNAHQIAKKGDTDAYQEVTASLSSKKLGTYGDIETIGSSGRMHRPPVGYSAENYGSFMNGFRAETMRLMRANGYQGRLGERN